MPRLGLLYGWQIGSLVPGIKGQDRNFLGDEMTGESMRREFNGLGYECDLYCEDHGYTVPDDLDIAIDMNPHCRGRDKAKKQILYFQNGLGEGSEAGFERMAHFYDGVAFSAIKMYEIYKDWVSRSGHKPIFLPIAGDEKRFFPVEPDPEFTYDVAYCGNDIKRHRTMPMLGPCKFYNFGLYGRWSEEHQGVLGGVSKGQINFNDLNKLYSSSKIMINIHFQDCIDYGLWAGRLYDVLLCNGLVVTDKPYGIPSDFEDYVVYTTGGEHLLEVLDKYINDGPARRQKTLHAREFILSKHTFKHRVATFSEYLKEFE